MSSGGVVFLAVGIGLLSVAITELVRRHAVRYGIIDRPNRRSSHSVPTPRGGGVAIVVLSAASLLLIRPWASPVALAAAFSSLLLVAGVGWIDDTAGASVRLRLTVHLAAGIVLAFGLLGPSTGEFSYPGLMAAAVGVWWVLWTVSLVNVINFMDGSDGLIAAQGVLYAGFAALVLPSGSPAAVFAVVVASAYLGFWVLNRHPARIFMGDVGSGASGILFLLLGALLLKENGWILVASYLPLAPLFVDETVTLVRRVAEGQNITVAHRSHHYQLLIVRGWSHTAVAWLFSGLAFPGMAIAVTFADRWLPLLLASGAYVIALGFILRMLVHSADPHTRAASRE